MHWTERRTAKANIGQALQARGWQLYGFHEDRSDLMTDYYAPASWDGIAEKDGYVIVVDVKRGEGSYSVLKQSDQEQEFTKSVRGDDCPHCGGSGLEPDGWTFEAAQADPRGFNLDRAKREGTGVSLFLDVVSPAHFQSEYQKCLKCHGAGHFWKSEVDRVVTWPTFQPNPNHKLWHVERDSRILASGIGLGPCAAHDQERREAAIERILRRIEGALCDVSHAVPGRATVNGVTIRRNREKNGIEVIFPAKPPVEVRNGLKRLRFRWSRRQGLWYARYNPALWERVHDLLQPDEVAAAPQPAPSPDEVSVKGIVFRRKTEHGQDFYYHTTQQGPLTLSWQAIRFQPDQEWFGVVTSDRQSGGSVATRPLTTVTRYDAYEERDPLYGQADPGDVDPPMRLLTALADLIASSADPFALPNKRVEIQKETVHDLLQPDEAAAIPQPAPSPEDPAPATLDEAITEAFQHSGIEDVIAEALMLDAAMHNPQGFPPEVADRLMELHSIAFRLDPDLNLDAEIRKRRAYDAPKLVRDWQNLTHKLEHGHSKRPTGRTQAHLGQLAQSRDQVLDALRIAVQQTQERGETIPFEISADAELARLIVQRTIQQPEPELNKVSTTNQHTYPPAKPEEYVAANAKTLRNERTK